MSYLSAQPSVNGDLAAKIKQNETKAKVRRLFKNIDEKKSGAISPKVFFDILQLHGIDLTFGCKEDLQKKFKIPGGYIDYKAAISVLQLEGSNNWSAPLAANARSSVGDKSSISRITY
jgi:hypothetical protein